jgi:hypothetical protein
MYLKVYLTTPPAGNEELFIADERPLDQLAAALVNDGYLVSERVTIRWSVIGFDQGGTHYRQDYFSAKPAGQIVLLASSVDYLVERVVPPGALPMPD